MKPRRPWGVEATSSAVLIGAAVAIHLAILLPVTRSFAQPLSFGAATNFAVGTQPFSMAIGDLNNDGNSDLVAANSVSNTVSVLLGTGSGSFGAATHYAVGSGPWGVAIGDISRDGNLDLAVANSSSNTVSVLLGTGTGTFGAATSFTVGTQPLFVAIGDFNGDGNSDLAVTNYATNTVSILLGSGTGGFGTPTNVGAGTTPYSVAIGDLNNDGNSDLAVTNAESNTVSVALGTGTGAFGTVTAYTAGITPYFVAIGDLNNDGNLDLAVATSSPNAVTVLLGTGTGTFGSAVAYPAGALPRSVAIGDLNGDGNRDLAAANINNDTVSVLLGTGTGSFGAAMSFPVGDGPYSVAIGDLSVDGKPDVAVANYVGNSVSVLLNTTVYTPQFALSVSKVGTGGGTVTSSPAGVDCGATCSALFDFGTLVTLTPVPDGTSTFAGWSGACSGTGACTVTMSAARSVTAAFATTDPTCPTLDQQSPVGTVNFNGSLLTQRRQQEVTAGLSGTLVGVEIYMWVVGGSSDLYINKGTPWQIDSNDFQTIVTPQVGGGNWFFIDTSSANINLSAGEKFVIGLQGRNTGEFWYAGSDPGAYSGGVLWSNIGGIAPTTADMAFRTYIRAPGSCSVDLSVTKTDSPDPVAVGTNLTYTIAVANASSGLASGVMLTDTLPSGATFVSASSTHGSCVGTSTVICNLGGLGGGASATVTIVVTPTETGTLTNTVSVMGNENDPDLSNNSATATTTVSAPTADLSTGKTYSPSVVQMGSNLTYTLVVTNNGPLAATGVTITDPLPSEVTFVSSSTSQGSCSGTSTVTCSLGGLANAASATVTIVVTPTAEGALTNTASVTGNEPDPNLSNNSSTAATIVNPTPVLMSVTPANRTINVGQAQQFTATGTFPLSGTAHIAAGDSHGCAVLSNGTVNCWGSNGYGALGNGTTSPATSKTPVTVSGITNATEIEAGFLHTCAVLLDGAVKCWGLNNSGQLGNGTTVNSSTPVSVSGIGNAVGIAAGTYYTCAVLSDGTVKCWGNNGIINSSTPVPVSGITTATAIATGGSHTCAVFSDGTIRCWGANGFGQLGNGTTTASSVPVAVGGITTATTITAGLNHTCAVLLDGTMRCWGSNAFGSLGNGTTTDSSVPVVVSGVATATETSAGDYHACAVLSEGTVRCWGVNWSGQLGNGTFTGGVPFGISTPVAVSGIATATSVAAGGDHSCAVLSDGTVQCWGDNRYDQLGNGAPYSSTPVTVSGAGVAGQISVGSEHACAIVSGGGVVKCWGDNLRGQLGIGAAISLPHPIPVLVGDITTATAIAAGSYHTCARLANGTVQCWGDTFSPSPVTVAGVNTAIALSAGGSHTCAVLSNGTVRCWGNNTYGQLGDGTTTSSSTPVTVGGITTATAVAAGGSHTCARLANGVVQCWGNNTFGALGNGTTINASTPVTVSGITAANTISSGGFHSCATLTDGTARCWGLNTYGQLGNGTTAPINSPLPITVNGIATAAVIATGENHTCVRLSDSTVHCWGANEYGQLGDGTFVDSPTPVTVGGISTATAVSAGGFTCARLSLNSGTIQCWGGNPGFAVMPVAVASPAPLVSGVVWSSSNPSVVSIDGSGIATGLTPGIVTITATYGSANGSTALGVTPIFAVSVSKTGTGGGTVISIPTGINCGAACGATFGSGTVVSLSATPDGTSTFSGWSGVCAGAGSCTVTMDAAKAVTATFTRIQYTVNVTKTGTGGGTVTSTPAGINCGGTCSAGFDTGMVVTLTATPDATSTFTGWSGACTGTGTCIVTMDAAKAVTATFTRIQYTLSVTKAGSGGGTVTSSPAGINCGAACATTFTIGTVVTLTATPDGTSTFTGWSGACTGTGSCIVTMDAAKSVTATFTRIQYTLSVTKAGSGNGTVTSTPAGINCGATCSAPFDAGTVVALTATADASSAFAGWSGACSGTGGCSVTMTAATSVTATFTARAADLAVTKADSPDPVTVNTGMTYTMVVTNNGPDRATGVTLTDPLPAGVTYVSATSTRGSCSQSAGTVTCTIGNLRDGRSATVTIVVTPTVTGLVSNTACVSANEGDPVPGNNCATEDTTVAPPTINTPTGSDVSVPLGSGLTVTFGTVSTAGETTLSIVTSGPPPPTSFRLGTLQVYYDLNTTATFSGPITVCLTYDDTQFRRENALRLFHYSGSTWSNVTTTLDTTGNVICGTTTSLSPFAVVEPDVGDLLSISTRALAGTQDNVAIAGIIVNGNVPKTVLIRGLGPTLSSFGVTGVLGNPVLELSWDDDNNANPPALVLCTNDDWGTLTAACSLPVEDVGTPQDIEATGKSANTYAPSNPNRHLDAALLLTLPPGTYTATLKGVNNTTGVGLVTVNDLDSSQTSTLLSLSTRAFVGTGDQVAIGGLIINGTTPKQVLIRGFGPTLSSFGVTGVLANPVLELSQDDDNNPNTPAVLIVSNDNWGTDLTTCPAPLVACGTATDIFNTGKSADTYAPANPNRHLDAALLVTLPPGTYTATLKGVNLGTGVGLIAVNEIGP